MGSALWAAVGGVGKGIAQNAQEGMAQEDKLAQIDYEATKREALARLEGNIAAANQSASNTQQYAFTLGAEGVRGMYNKETEAQKAADELELQKLRNQGALDVAKLHKTGAGSIPTWMKNRWGFGKVAGGEEQHFADIPTLQDRKTGAQYTQQGNNFVLAGGKMAPAPQGAIDLLAGHLGDESVVDQFLSKYNYLPGTVVRQMQSVMTSVPSSGKDQSDESDDNSDSE